MAFKLFDRVKETSTSTGTGDLNLAGAVSQFQAFSARYSNTDTFYYCIQDQSGTQWETGKGTYNSGANSITRTTVQESTNSNAAVNFTSAALYIFVIFPAAEMGVPGLTIPQIQASGRSTAQTAAISSITAFTVGAADGTFIVSANVNVTTATAHSFSVQVTYTDETNTSRTVTFNVQQLGGTLVTSITNVTGVGPYEGVPLHIRAKAATAITILTSGTFTTVTYNAEGYIQQLG